MDRYYGIDSTYTCYNCNKVYNVSRNSSYCPICGRENEQKRYYSPQQLEKIKWQANFRKNFNYKIHQENVKRNQQQCKQCFQKNYILVIVIGSIIIAIGLFLIIKAIIDSEFWIIISGVITLLIGFSFAWIGIKSRKKSHTPSIKAANIPPPQETLQEAFQDSI